MKIRTRKRTAAEKERDQAKKEKKKELRKEKRETRKDARKDKKDIRNLDLSRKDKKDWINDINADKKSDIKEIKEELKEVKQSLEIILPVKTANVALLREDLRDIKFNDGTGIREVTIDDAYAILNQAFDRSIRLAEAGLAYIKPFANLSERPSWIADWNGDALLVQWFGEIDHVNNVSDVFNRLNSVVERLNKKITIRLHPQRDSTTSAMNAGTFFEPKMFKVYPYLIEKSLDLATLQLDYDKMASVLIHELIHVWFTDQKLNGDTVYGAILAMDLAIEKPRKARRSAENYEHFCLSFGPLLT